jgi:hypothetical protein
LGNKFSYNVNLYGRIIPGKGKNGQKKIGENK